MTPLAVRLDRRVKENTLVEIDDEERTNSIGLFNTAEAWRLSAMALQAQRVKSGHTDQPVRFLYRHAIELYLKALLRQRYGVKKLEDFGHKMKRLAKKAQSVGLTITDDASAVFSLIEFRYIRTGAKTLPTLEALSRTCNSVRDGVRSLLRHNNVPVR
jgi:HEPN domain-containing protein